ncbi:alkaline phosphatase family protein [Burkholderia cepacia]|uniref:alkaline phosphatase family protein n=1 Tax=Burkholderia cepacia TaxID=292 RepID=UPI0009BE18AD|nr:alkaline phosphatase family protein [Burkholderia cepacia]
MRPMTRERKVGKDKEKEKGLDESESGDRLFPGVIKHIVVLMLENRGFDHLMGWLYSRDEDPTIVPGDNPEPFRGLSTYGENRNALQNLANPVPPSCASEGPIEPIRATRSPATPVYGPGEKYQHIRRQIRGPEDLGSISGSSSRADMKGFVVDFDDVLRKEHKMRDPGPTRETLSQIMETYIPQQLPVLSGLARYYAVSDDWYCSVPSQTNTNRAFSMAGTSRGLVDNNFYHPAFRDPAAWAGRAASSARNWWNQESGDWSLPELAGTEADTLPASTRCLFDVLGAFGIGWKVYWQRPWPLTPLKEWNQYVRTMLPLLYGSDFNANFAQFSADDPNNAFYTAARDGTLPAVSWIEPKWGGGPSWELSLTGNDYHPVGDTTVGEDFVMNVYNALSTGKNWSDTLFIITFDENGGTYDHMVPPPAPPSDLDRCPLPGDRTGRGMDPATRTQFGFEFDQYGVRVPTLVISPRVGRSTIFRPKGSILPFDHASIIATILSMAGIERRFWQLGSRVANAPTFEYLINEDLREDALAEPSSALTVPAAFDPDSDWDPYHDSDSANELDTSQIYVLEYVGNPWRQERGEPLYLAKATSAVHRYSRRTWWYPTVSENRDLKVRVALSYRTGELDGKTQASRILNMSALYIRCHERDKWWNLSVLDSKDAYLSDDPRALWQIRLCNSRQPDSPVKVGDYVYFVSLSKCVPRKAFDGDRELFDVSPFSDRIPTRLMPIGDDASHLCDKAGEWAVWRVVQAEDASSSQGV